MKQSDPLVRNLRALEAFDDLHPKPVDSESGLERLRAMLPASILGHYDYRRRRSQRGLTAVINGACGHCQTAVPKGLILQLQQSGALGMCPECSGYLFFEEPSLGELDVSARRQKSGGL
jgi:predicted  nucleic acid-binding Zn-ribbon protein